MRQANITVFALLVAASALARTPIAAADPWGAAYERACTDAGAFVSLGPDGSSVFACGARFDAGTGRFGGATTGTALAVLPSGVELARAVDGGELTLAGAHAPVGNAVEAAAVAGDGARVVTIERRAVRVRRRFEDRFRVVLRELPSLREVRSAALDVAQTLSGGAVVSFLPDGRVAVLAPQGDCDPTADVDQDAACAGGRVMAFDPQTGRMEPLATLPEGVRRVAFDPGGACAAVALGNGAVKLVALSDGATLAELPSVAAGAPTVSALAVSAGGARVAVAAGDAVRVFERAGAGVLLEARQYGVRALQFAASGDALYAVGPESLVAYRAGAAPWSARGEYTPGGIDGLVGARVEGGFVHWPDEPEPSLGVNVPREFQAIAAYRVADNGLWNEFVVRAGDPGEFDAALPADAWARAVVARYVASEYVDTEQKLQAAHLRAWGEPGARGAALELEHEVGCELGRFSWRFQERGGVLYRAELMAVPPEPTRESAMVTALLDTPFGRAPAPAPAPAPRHRAHPGR